MSAHLASVPFQILLDDGTWQMMTRAELRALVPACVSDALLLKRLSTSHRLSRLCETRAAAQARGRALLGKSAVPATPASQARRAASGYK